MSSNPSNETSADQGGRGSPSLIVGKGRKPYAPYERRYLVEWVSKTFPNARVVYNVQLGAAVGQVPIALTGQYNPNLFKPWLPRADAVVIEDKRVVIVEAMITPNPNKWAQLVTYAKAFRLTPEFIAEREKPIDLILVYAYVEQWALMLAADHGIRSVQYYPPWLADLDKNR